MICTVQRAAPSSDDRIDSRVPVSLEGTPPSEHEGKGCFGGRKRIEDIGTSWPGEILADQIAEPIPLLLIGHREQRAKHRIERRSLIRSEEIGARLALE